MKNMLFVFIYSFLLTHPMFSHNPGITVDGLDYQLYQKHSYASGGWCKKKDTFKKNTNNKIEEKVLICSTKLNNRMDSFLKWFHELCELQKVFNKEIFHKIGTPYLIILGGCYKTNKSLIRWASIKEIDRVPILEESTLDLETMVLTIKGKYPLNIKTSNLVKVKNCEMFDNLDHYTDHIKRKLQTD